MQKEMGDLRLRLEKTTSKEGLGYMKNFLMFLH